MHKHGVLRHSAYRLQLEHADFAADCRAAEEAMYDAPSEERVGFRDWTLRLFVFAMCFIIAMLVQGAITYWLPQARIAWTVLASMVAGALGQAIIDRA